MPELPEVETVVKSLQREICGQIIEKVLVTEEMIIGYPSDVEDFKARLKNKEILELRRRGKYIVIRLSANFLLIIHLRMTGQLLVKDRGADKEKHTHVIIEFKEGFDLRFNNVRKFGRMYLVTEEELEQAGGFTELGPEPLSANFDFAYFSGLTQKSRQKIKALLLDQRKIAGLGNIYTDEALYRSGIDPQRPANSLTSKEIKKLLKNIKKVLQAGIKYNGTTFSDYVNALGESGSFQKKLLVYGRKGESCNYCGCNISKDKVAGRSTHFCPECQS